MKSFFALALLSVCLLEPIQARYNLNRLLHPGVTECLSDHDVAPLTLFASAKGQLKDIDIHTMCAIKCIFKHIGLVDELGQLNTKDILDIIEDPDLKNYLSPYLNNCANMAGSSSCEAATLTIKCLKDGFRN